MKPTFAWVAVLILGLVVAGWVWQRQAVAPSQVGVSEAGAPAQAAESMPVRADVSASAASGASPAAALQTPAVTRPDPDIGLRFAQATNLYDFYRDNNGSRVPREALVAAETVSLCLASQQTTPVSTDPTRAAHLTLLRQRCAGFGLEGVSLAASAAARARWKELMQAMRDDRQVLNRELPRQRDAVLQDWISQQSVVGLYLLRDELWPGRAPDDARSAEPDLSAMAFLAALCDRGLPCASDSSIYLSWSVVAATPTAPGETLATLLADGLQREGPAHLPEFNRLRAAFSAALGSWQSGAPAAQVLEQLRSIARS